MEALSRQPSWATDVVVAGVVAVPTAMDAWWNEEGTRQADAFTYAMVVVSIGALLGRRRWPVGVALVCGLALSALYVAGHHGELLNLPVMVALYTVADRGDRRSTVVTAIVAATWSGALGFTSDDPLGARGGSPVLEAIWPLVPLALGEAVRSRRELVALAARQREREARHRVEAERAEIARELHDVIAHTLAGVNVQMAAAIAAFDSDPETARAALVEARGSTRAALGELRATVAVLRESHGTAPAPRLDDLDDLLPAVRAAGIELAVEDGRDGLPVPAATEVAAYRIVQESLTNVVRHSGARHAAVSLRRDPEGLVVEVVDDGTAAAADAATPGGGFGLVGMAERARAVGGRVDHGPRPEGGFGVRAVLPVPAAAEVPR